MSSSPSSSVNSQASSDPMAHTTATMSLFTRDLELNSAGSSGRKLWGVIESLGFDTLGASRPLDLALALQEATSERDALLGHYLGAATTEPWLTSFVMVAVTPAVATVVARCASFIGRAAFSEELQITLLEQLRTISDHPAELRRRWLATSAVAAARAATRRSVRRSVPTAGIPDDFDFAELTEDDRHVEELLEVLWLAVGTVITNDEFVLIDCTRVWGVELSWMAERYGISYDAARMQRTRAEAKVRAFIRAEVSR